VTAQTRGSGHDWDDSRKAALFARIVGLELSIEEAAELHGLRVDVIQDWLRLFRRSALLAFDEELKQTLIGQGANADALAAAEFTGHIEDVSIADLVQTIAIAGKDAVITVTREGRDHRMWCSAGAIIDAESGRLSGEAAAFRMLAFERGRMVADLRPEPRDRSINNATHRLLLEAMHRKDDCTALLARLGSVDRCYRLGDRSTSARVHVSTDELSILRCFDGARCIGDILAQSELGDLETLTALARLVDGGYLVSAEGAPVPSASDTRPAPTRPAHARPAHARPARGARTADTRSADTCSADSRSTTDTRSSGTRPAGAARSASGTRSASGIRSAGAARSDSAHPGSATRSDAALTDGSARPRGTGRASRAASPTEPRRRRGGVRAPVERSSGPRASQAGERATAASPAERDAQSSPASAPASYMPFAVPLAPAARAALTPRWVFAAMAAAALAPAAFWFGETMSNLRAARRARVHDTQPATAYAPLADGRSLAVEPARTFEVSTRVEPAAATIWLDHHPVASGQLDIVLSKDGRTHELRAAADGYVPITLLFADVAPPREIELEPLPVPRSALAAVVMRPEPASVPQLSAPKPSPPRPPLPVPPQPISARSAAPGVAADPHPGAATTAATDAQPPVVVSGASERASAPPATPSAPPLADSPRAASPAPLGLPSEPHLQIDDSHHAPDTPGHE
jgi:Domain of unknown function (DUF4388)